MLFTSVLLAAAAGSVWAAPVESENDAACKGNKPIDNFASWSNKTNSLGSVSGDDKTMSAISVTGSTISLTPKTGAYFYENLPCENAESDGYNAIAFKVGGPAQSSFLLEVQTKTNCSAAAHTSVYHNVTVPATAGTVTIPFSDFKDAHFNGISSLTFSTFNKTGAAYTLSDIELVCGSK